MLLRFFGRARSRRLSLNASGRTHRRATGMVGGLLTGLLGGIAGVISPQVDSRIDAAEPAERFIEQLREEAMFDWAAKYIDIYGKAGWLPEKFKKDADLERLMILQDSLATVRTVAQRDSILEEIEKGFDNYLASTPDSPRRSEARLRLGNISLARGQAELKKLDDPKESANSEAIRKAARGHLTKGNAAFAAAVAELKTNIEKLAGNRATTPEDIELRKKLQGEYRQAQIFDGFSSKLIATSYPKNAKEYTEWLKKSETKLSEVISKAVSATEIGAKTLSRLYRGDVLALMGEADKAIESYTPVADIEEPGIFRQWRVQAITSIIRVLSSESGKNRFQDAIQRGDALLKQMDRNERGNAEWIDLQLATAEAKVGLAKSLASQKDKQAVVKDQKKDARELLSAIVRLPGDHQTKAKQMLSDLGVEAVDPNESKLPKVRTFAEAFKAGRERLQKSDSVNLALEILNDRLKTASKEEKPAIEKEIQATRDASARDLGQALELFMQSFKLFGPEDERSDLLEARFFATFILLKQEKFWDAATTGDFVARSGAGTDTGLKGANFALFAYSRLIAAMPKEQQTNLLPPLESLAKHMLAIWPQAEETQTATITLLQQALANQLWDESERFLRLLPPENDQSKAIKRDLGYILYIEYLKSIDAARQAAKESSTESSNAAATANIPGNLELRDRAEKLLKEGWDVLVADKVDQRSVEAASALVSIYLNTNRLEEANAIFAKEGTSPLKLVEANDDRIKSSQAKMEVLRLNLRSKVMAASQGGSALSASDVESIVKKMQQVAGDGEEGSKLLTNSLLVLAKELQEQLASVKDTSEQAKLASGIRVLMKQLAEVSNDAGILDWSGTTLLQLADGLKSNPSLTAVNKELNQSAAEIFTKMIELSSKDGEFLKSIKRTTEDIQYKQGLTYRAMGDYQKAADVFVAVLKANPNQLSAQIEAAKNYQEWGKGKDVDLLKKSYLGSEFDPKVRKNLVWGWGNIAKTLSSSIGTRPDLKRVFFDARLQLANSRYLSAMVTPEATAKKKILEQSRSDIKQTLLMYPDLDGPESKAEFDKMTMTIQRELGEPAIGLKEFEPKPATDPTK